MDLSGISEVSVAGIILVEPLPGRRTHVGDNYAKGLQFTPPRLVACLEQSLPEVSRTASELFNAELGFFLGTTWRAIDHRWRAHHLGLRRPGQRCITTVAQNSFLLEEACGEEHATNHGCGRQPSR